MDKRCDKCNTPLQYTEGKLLYCALCNIEYVSLKRRLPSEDEVKATLAHRICKKCVYYSGVPSNYCNLLDRHFSPDFGCNKWEERK